MIHLQERRKTRSKKTPKGKRSGRYSLRELHESSLPNQKRAPAPKEGELLRLLPKLERDQPGLASDYSCRLERGQIARVQLEQRSNREAWIDWVYIPPNHRGRGLGRQLLERVLADADRLGISIGLEARACAGIDQVSLVRFYQSFGFALTGEQGPFGPELRRLPQQQALRQAA